MGLELRIRTPSMLGMSQYEILLQQIVMQTQTQMQNQACKCCAEPSQFAASYAGMRSFADAIVSECSVYC